MSGGKTIIANTFFLEILKAICLTFNWVPKLIQISFQVIEQKLVQRCETKVDADACKAFIWCAVWGYYVLKCTANVRGNGSNFLTAWFWMSWTCEVSKIIFKKELDYYQIYYRIYTIHYKCALSLLYIGQMEATFWWLGFTVHIYGQYNWVGLKKDSGHYVLHI